MNTGNRPKERPLEAKSMKRLLELLRLVRRYITCRKGLLWKINQLLS